MFFLDNDSGVDVMPVITNKKSNTVKWFTEGDNVNPESWPGQDWFNIVQAELLNLLKEAAIEPNKTNLNQLSAAIKQIILKNKVDINDASLTQKGIVQLSSATDSDLETKASTPKATKAAFDLANTAKTTAEGALSKSTGGTVSADTNFTKKLQQAGNDVITTKTIRNYQNEIGVNQTWQNVTASRVQNVVYQNTTGKPIFVAIIKSGTNNTVLAGTFYVDDVVVGVNTSSTQAMQSSAIVPNGSTYKYTSNTIEAWSELR